MLIINVKLHPRHTLIKTCPICKNIFPQKGKGNKKYCSPQCSHIAKKQQMIKIHQKECENRDSFKHATKMRELYYINQLKEIQICPICTERFQIIRRNMKYCSPKCASIAKKQQTKESNQKMIQNRDKIKHAAKMRELYHTNLLKKNKKPIGTITIPPTPIQETTTGGGGEINLRLGYISSNINKRKKKIRLKNTNRLPRGELTC